MNDEELTERLNKHLKDHQELIMYLKSERDKHGEEAEFAVGQGLFDPCKPLDDAAAMALLSAYKHGVLCQEFQNALHHILPEVENADLKAIGKIEEMLISYLCMNKQE